MQEDKIGPEHHRFEGERVRDAMEVERLDAEQARRAAEHARIEAETARHAAETDRTAAEAARVESEQLRNAAMADVRATGEALAATLEQMKAVEEMRRFRDLLQHKKLDSN